MTNILKAPAFPNDPEMSRRARALHALQLNMGGAILFLGLAGVLFIFAEKIVTSSILVAGIFSVMVGMTLNHRGHVKASALVMLVFLWILTVCMTIVSGGMRSLDIIFFVSGTVIAGISLGAGAAVLYAALSLFTGLGLILAESWGVVFLHLFSFPPLSAWIILLINLIFTVAPLHVTLQTLSDSAVQARFNEERYRLIASVMSDYVFSLQFGPNGEITNQWMGGAFESITGYTPEAFYQRGGWAAIVHPADREQDARDMAELRANRKVITEIRLIRRDGATRWVRSYANPVWDASRGQLAGIYGAVQDITEQKITGNELNQRMAEVAVLYRLSVALTGGQNLYDALRAFVRELKHVMVVDAFHIGLYDAETDIFSYSLFLNLEEDLLPPPRKLREKPGLTWEVISNRKTLYLKDVADPQTQSSYNIVVVVEAPIRSYIGIPLLLQDRVIGIMSIQSLKPDAYTGEQVRLLEMLAAQVVITIEKMRLLDQVRQELEERRKADAELQQREAILEIVSGAANTLLNMSEWNLEVWRTEINNLLEQLGETIHASHAYVFENHPFRDGSIRMSMRYEWTAPGYESDLDDPHYQDMTMGQDNMQSWNDYIYRGLPFIGDNAHLNQDDMENLQNRDIQALLDVPIFVDEQWWGIIGFDDMSQPRNWSIAEVDALVVAANLMGAAIKRRQMDSIQKDELQQRKILIEELESKNTELEQFNYTVSHDLKSPLVTIKGFLGYLEEDAASGNMDRLKRDIGRIAIAVDKMNTLLSDLLELSRIGHGMQALDCLPLGDLIQEAVDLTHGQLAARRVVIEYPPDLPSVYVNKRRMVEVLQNLIDNAAKFMGNQPQPKIEIGQQGEEDGKPIFFVKDNGIGITTEYHERIFGLFNKLDAVSEGTGVGLALVKRIIEYHGGRIWVESEAGKGSTFYFTMPPG